MMMNLHPSASYPKDKGSKLAILVLSPADLHGHPWLWLSFVDEVWGGALFVVVMKALQC